MAVCLKWSLEEKTLPDSQNFDSGGPVKDRLSTVVGIEGGLTFEGTRLGSSQLAESMQHSSRDCKNGHCPHHPLFYSIVIAADN